MGIYERVARLITLNGIDSQLSLWGVEKKMIDLHYFALHLHSFTLRAREIIFRDMIYDVLGSDRLIELIHLFLPENKRL